MKKKHNRKYRAYLRKFIEKNYKNVGIILKVSENENTLIAVDVAGKEYILEKKNWKEFLKQNWE